MREKLFILILFLMLIVGLGAQSFQDNFNKASQLYEDGNFKESLKIYLGIEKYIKNWKLFYNTGNCYFKLNQFVEAKIYYLRSKKLKPFNNSINKNIEIVNRKFKDKIPKPKLDFFNKLLLRIESILSLNFISSILLILILILNIFIFMLLIDGKNKLVVYFISFLFIFTILVSFYHIYRVSKHNLKESAVIIDNNVELRSGPGDNNTVLFKVNQGLEVKIIERSKNWLQVSASSQIAGWMKEKKLEKI